MKHPNKSHTAWNKGLKISLKPLTGWSINCVVCGKSKYYQLNEHKKRKRIYCSLDCYHLDSRVKTNIKYSTIHNRIKRDWGCASECEYCKSVKNVDWANVSGKYLLERNDWKMLCRKCHIAYDKNNQNYAYLKFINQTT